MSSTRFYARKDKIMTQVRPVGVAMSDGTVMPFETALGGVRELSARRGVPKSTVATWWARGRSGLTINEFPKPVFYPSTGPLFYLPDIDGFVPGTSVAAARARNSGRGS